MSSTDVDVEPGHVGRDGFDRSSAPVRVVRVGLLGYGRIGQAVAARAVADRGRLIAAGVDVRCVAALVRDPGKPRSGPALTLAPDATALDRSSIDLVIEVLGGVEPARRLVTDALRAGRPVVTANKTLMAHHGLELAALAERRGVAFAYDASVLAGVPFLGALARRPFVSAARRLTGIINGTSHFVVSALAAGSPFEAALADAVSRGYAEPDSSADLSGRDAAEKLTILLHLAGCRDVAVGDLPCASVALLTPRDLKAARWLGGTLKPVAGASLQPGRGGAWVGPAFVSYDHPFARLDGVTNALELVPQVGEAVTFTGAGAGPEATAATILDDLVEAVAGRPITSASRRPLPPPVRAAELRSPAAGRWFLRLGVLNEPAHRVAERLASHGVPAEQVVAEADHVYARTRPAPWSAVAGLVDVLGTPSARALALPVVS